MLRSLLMACRVSDGWVETCKGYHTIHMDGIQMDIR
jgi:hypothetical protein